MSVEIKLDPTLSIAADFPAASDEQWREAATALLKGAPLEKLYTKTPEGVTISPLYTSTDRDAAAEAANGMPGAAPYVRGNGTTGWTVCRRYTVDDLDTLNASLAQDTARGVEAVWLALSGADQIAPVFAALAALPEPPVFFLNLPATDWGELAAYVTAHTDDLANWRGGLYLDPMSALATGDLDAADLARAFDRIAEISNHCVAHNPDFGSVAVSLEPVHNAGADMATELAVFVTSIATILRELETRGMTLEKAAGCFEVVVPAGRDTFREIAKLRALRGLWSRLLVACGIDTPPPIRINSVASMRTMTQRDRWVNMLRATGQAFSGAVAGADVITTRAYDELTGGPTELGRRMAINTQLILQQESDLGFVADPAGGSFYLEQMTRDLQAEAWQRVQAIEGGGGLLAWMTDGRLAAHIEEIADARATDIARRKASIIGVSAYANPDEDPLAEGINATGPDAGALPLRRDAAPFEALRDAADAYAADHGDLPTIFLANLGSIPRHKARATFAQNFFAAGGIRSVTNDGFAGADEAAAAFQDSGAKIAVICSADDVYAEHAAATASALKQAGAAAVWLAGKPGEHESAWRDAGVDHFIFMGGNVLAELKTALHAYGVNS